MNFSEFRNSIANPETVYLLVNAQDYLKNKVYGLCQKQVKRDARSFDWSVFDLDTDSVSKLLNVARTLPWMSRKRWVYAKNVDPFIKELSKYLANPSERTTLVLEVKRKPRPWSKFTTIELPGGTHPINWVIATAKREGYEIDFEVAEALVGLVGEDYQQLNLELEKQFLFELETRKITMDSVLEMTLQVREHDVFMLINALSKGKTASALRVLERLLSSGTTVPQIVSILYWNFKRVLVAREMLDQGRSFRSVLPELKIWSYKNREVQIRQYSHNILQQILIRLCEMDRLCKTTSSDSEAHLVRVIVDTCNR